MSELVCPNFYADEWRKLGRPCSQIATCAEFPIAADDGVCRVMKTKRDEDGGLLLVCRCGIEFSQEQAQRIEVAR